MCLERVQRRESIYFKPRSFFLILFIYLYLNRKRKSNVEFIIALRASWARHLQRQTDCVIHYIVCRPTAGFLEKKNKAKWLCVIIYEWNCVELPPKAINLECNFLLFIRTTYCKDLFVIMMCTDFSFHYSDKEFSLWGDTTQIISIFSLSTLAESNEFTIL